MKKNLSKKLICGLGISVLSYGSAIAQMTLTGQVRTRSEYRAGQGTLQQSGDEPAIFTSQRTRLNFGYTGYRFKFFTAVQDVRVWGQDASTINRTTQEALNGLMIHEAYGEILLNDTAPLSKIENLSLKIGRQEIAYDDQKILGSLDWLQQARRHDAAVLKFSNKGWMVDLGVAYNQNKELNSYNRYNGVPATIATAGTNTISATPAYTAGTNGIGTTYKSFQYLYIGKKFFFGNGSLLCFKDDFNKTQTIAGANQVIGGEWSRLTTGAYLNAIILKKFTVTGSAYYQTGKDKTGRNLEAYLGSITTSLQLGRKLYIGPGMDYLSGDNGTRVMTSDEKSRRFDPLYGTPHKFWGFMDYFYVASPFGSQGLKNYFFKIKYKAKDNLTLTVDLHNFAAANKVSDGKGGTQSATLGNEVDFTANYAMTKAVSFELGYSMMSASSTMASAQVKNVKDPEKTAQWAYLMIVIKPNFMPTK
jgi:hypothetical protein